MSKSGSSITYGYNANGKRISKTVNGTTYNYAYLGDALTDLSWGSNRMHFTYDSLGVFQSAGSIIFLTETETIDGFPGLGRRIPVTMGCFAALALSLVGIPPFGGFFSKWYLMLGAYQGGQYFYIVILVISSLLNAVYFFRILEQMFVQHEASLTEINRHEGKLGLPPEMAIPILCAGIGILVLGFYSVDIVDDILKSGLPEVFLR